MGAEEEEETVRGRKGGCVRFEESGAGEGEVGGLRGVEGRV